MFDTGSAGFTYKDTQMKEKPTVFPAFPEVKFNRNGYEIRTEILGMAKDLVEAEYQSRFNGWHISATRDDKTGQMVTTVAMPEFPNLDKILETAEKMYSFVNKSK
jgi:hypothetical protein